MKDGPYASLIRNDDPIGHLNLVPLDGGKFTNLFKQMCSYAVAIRSCLKIGSCCNDEYDLSIVLQQKICVFNFPYFLFHDQCSPQIYIKISNETLEIYKLYIIIYINIHVTYRSVKVKGKPQQTLSSWDRWPVQKLHAGPRPIVSKPDANDGNRFYGDE
jgi:hypothetical protein